MPGIRSSICRIIFTTAITPNLFFMDQSKAKWYHEVWFIIFMLILLGPFAFPLLWKSSKFSRAFKWIVTILFSIVTLLAVWFSIEVVKLVWKQVQEIQAALISAGV